MKKAMSIAIVAAVAAACGADPGAESNLGENVIAEDINMLATGPRQGYYQQIAGACEQYEVPSDAGCPEPTVAVGGPVRVFSRQGMADAITNLRKKLATLYSPGSALSRQEQVAADFYCGRCLAVVDCHYWEGGGRENQSGVAGLSGPVFKEFHCAFAPDVGE